MPKKILQYLFQYYIFLSYFCGAITKLIIMAKEIERKYLVNSELYKSMAQCVKYIEQGYLSLQKEATVRVRIKENCAFLTIKGLSMGAVRDEWEYQIPIEEAREMLSQCCQSDLISKHRYEVVYEGFLWEIDEFHGRHEGLVVAEIELGAEDESFPLPPFIGEEVTGDPAYYNSSLSGI